MKPDPDKILVIQHDPDRMQDLEKLIIVTFPETEILTVTDGSSWFSQYGTKEPDLIVMDSMNADRECFGTIEGIRKDPLLKQIPVVVITSRDTGKQSRIMAMEAGADAFFSEPFDETEFKTLVRAMMKIRTAGGGRRINTEELSRLIGDRTRELDDNRIAMLNLLEDLKNENEARKESESRLAESEEKYRQMVNLSPDAIIVHAGGKLLFANQAAISMVGADSFDQMQQRPLMEYVHPEFRQLAAGRIGRIYETMEPAPFTEEKFLDLQGRVIDVDVIGIPVVFDGKPAVQTTVRNITERKKAADTLKASEEKYRLLYETIPVGVGLADQQGNMYEANPAMLKLLGYSLEELKGLSVSAMYQDATDRNYLIGQLKQSGFLRDWHVRLRRKDGTVFSALVNTDLIQHENAQLLLTTVRDITLQQQFEEALKQQKNFFEQMFLQSSVSTQILDHEGWCERVNSKLSQIFGVEPQHIEGKVYNIFNDQEIISKGIDKVLAKVFREGKTVEWQVLFDIGHASESPSQQVDVKEKKKVWYDNWAYPIFDENKRLSHVIIQHTDISRRKEVEQKLERSLELQQMLLKLATEFVNMPVDQLDEQISKTLVMVGEFIKVDRAYLFSYDFIKGIMTNTHEWCSPGTRPEIDNLQAVPNDAIPEWVESHLAGKLIHIPRVADLPEKSELRAILEAQDIQTLITLPLFVKGRCVGFVGFDAVHDIRIWDDDELNILHVLAQILSNAQERKSTESALKSEAMRRKILMDASYDGIAIFDQDYRLVDANRRFAEMLDYTFEELRSRRIWEIDAVHEESEIRKVFSDIVSVSQTFETKHHRKGGTVLDVEVSASGARVDDSPLIFTLCRDITQRKRTELIQQIQYNIANAVVSVDLLNELFSIVQHELNKMIDATNFFVAFYDEKRNLLFAPFEKDEKDAVPGYWTAEKSLTGKVIMAKAPLLIRKDEIKALADRGEIEYIGARAEVWLGVPLNIGGKVTGAIVVQSYDNPAAFDRQSVDILEIVANQLSNYIERKRSQEEALMLSKAIEQSPVSIVITDPAGCIEYVNPKFCEITGYSMEDVIGQNPRILKSGAQDEAFYEHLWRTITAGGDWNGEIQNRKKNGDLYWENAIISPILNQQGKITHFLGLKEDISEKKNIMTQLLAAKEKAEESERLKTSFLANMSHELRTPMTGILGYAELLNESRLDAEQTKMASYILESGNRLMETLNLILDLSKLEAEQTEISVNMLDLVVLAQSVVKSYMPGALKKQLYLSFDTSRDHIYMQSNERMLSSVFHNLINNALKYTMSGGITVTIDLEEGPYGNCAVCSVQDTGIGIPEEFHETIFDEFRQVSEGYSRHFEGSGLGLSITKRFVEKMNGTISVNSSLGQGTEFIVRLPLTGTGGEMQQQTAQAEMQPDILQLSALKERNIRALLVEDDVINQSLMISFLRGTIAVDVASSGQEALEKLSENRYDAVLLDIHLGTEMDGIDVLNFIRRQPGLAGLPVAALTAYAMKGDEANYLSQGFDAYLSKPFKRNDLYGLISSMLRK